MNLSAKIFGKGLPALLLLGNGAASAKEEPKKPKVMDLNQVDLEQVEEDWENQPATPQINPDRGVKIKDIIEPSSEYTYASFGKPDPFSMPQLEVPKSDLPPGAGPAGIGGSGATGSKEITVTSPLQNYPMSALKVTGVWQKENAELRAMVMTPKNESIIVKVGDPISSGKLLQIERDAIVVRLYRIRKDGIREYQDTRIAFGSDAKAVRGTIKLEPGKEAQFPGTEKPADEANPFKLPDSAASAPGAAAAGAAKQGQDAVKAEGNVAKNIVPPPAPVPAPATPVLAPPAAGAVGLGWPYNTGAAAAPAVPTSRRPGSK